MSTDVFKKRKIAILGNMNNNGFALLRYLLELGEDCYLLLYSNDGNGSYSHFRPELDSFEIDRWKSRIVETGIHDSYYQALNDIFAFFVVTILDIKNKIFPGKEKINLISHKKIKKIFDDYDVIITSGYGPSILAQSGIHVDIFAPYSIGMEGVGRKFYAPSVRGGRSLVLRILFEYVRHLQIKALKRVHYIYSADAGETRKNIIELGLGNKLRQLQYPLVFVEDYTPDQTGNQRIDEIYKSLKTYDFVVMTHCRLAWTTQLVHAGKIAPKNNHWLFEAFQEVVRQNSKAVLLVAEYGPEVEYSKKFVKELGIDSNVLWIPQTSRKNLMWLLKHVHVGVGEFIQIERTLWGGTGLEVMASAKPLIHGFLFEEGEYEALYGHKEPPLLKVKKPDDVKRHLLYLMNNKNEGRELGLACQRWFDLHNGKSLAKEWMNLLDCLNIGDSIGLKKEI